MIPALSYVRLKVSPAIRYALFLIESSIVFGFQTCSLNVSFEGKKVVFPTGIIEDKNGKDILLYSGAGDTYTSIKRIRISDIFDSFEEV